MPNGSDLTLEEFDALEALILPFDDVISQFAMRIGASITVNYHYSPGRILQFGTMEGLSAQLNIDAGFLDYCKRQTPVCMLAAFAYRDIPPVREEIVQLFGLPRRKSWHKELARWTAQQDIEKELRQVLEDGYTILQEVKEIDLH